MTEQQKRQFLANVNKQSGVRLNNLTTECWIWEAGKCNEGYGQLQTKWAKELGTHKAHRLSFHLFKEEFLPTKDRNKDLLHSCDNPSCVNPEHLRFGNMTENMKERDERGRQVSLQGFQHGSSIFTPSDVDKIVFMRLTGKTHQQIWEEMGCERPTIKRLLTGKTYEKINYEELIQAKKVVLRELLDNRIRRLKANGLSYSQITAETGRSSTYISNLLNK
jgi:uncharacterized protein YerC